MKSHDFTCCTFTSGVDGSTAAWHAGQKRQDMWNFQVCRMPPGMLAEYMPEDGGRVMSFRV